MGLLRPSFVPPPEIRALRDLTRTRLQLVRDRTREWQRLEKLLEGALIKLSSVVARLARTKTARHILEALADGQRDPKALAAMAALIPGDLRAQARNVSPLIRGVLVELDLSPAGVGDPRLDINTGNDLSLRHGRSPWFPVRIPAPAPGMGPCGLARPGACPTPMRLG